MQGEVVRALGASRSTVVRLLRRAKGSGLVRITLGVPRDVFEVEREVEWLYGLGRVRLVPETGDDKKLKQLARARGVRVASRERGTGLTTPLS